MKYPAKILSVVLVPLAFLGCKKEQAAPSETPQGRTIDVGAIVDSIAANMCSLTCAADAHCTACGCTGRLTTTIIYVEADDGSLVQNTAYGPVTCAISYAFPLMSMLDNYACESTFVDVGCTKTELDAVARSISVDASIECRGAPGTVMLQARVGQSPLTAPIESTVSVAVGGARETLRIDIPEEAKDVWSVPVFAPEETPTPTEVPTLNDSSSPIPSPAPSATPVPSSTPATRTSTTLTTSPVPTSTPTDDGGNG